MKLVVRKYAQAFLNSFGDKIERNDMLAIQKFATFLADNSRISFFLGLSIIDVAVKKDIIQKLVAQFNVPDQFTELARILIEHRHGFLLYKVVRAIFRLYQCRYKVALFTVTSSHKISDEQERIAKQFLADKTECDIIEQKVIDKQLIAGVRLQSDLWLWEYSIDKQLKNIAKNGI